MRILSEKLVEVTSVATPLTSPEASRDLAGKPSSLTSMDAMVKYFVITTNSWALKVDGSNPHSGCDETEWSGGSESPTMAPR